MTIIRVTTIGTNGYVNIGDTIVLISASVNKIHPNPKDEFSDPKIGPNFSIVSDYVNKFRTAQNRGEIRKKYCLKSFPISTEYRFILMMKRLLCLMERLMALRYISLMLMMMSGEKRLWKELTRYRKGEAYASE